MDSTTSFELFPTLPKELRLAIWDFAFSAPTAAIAKELPVRCENKQRINEWYFDLVSDGVVPYQIGTSCKEAWQVMVDMCVRFTTQNVGSARIVSQHWLNPDSTVFIIDEDFITTFAITTQFARAECHTQIRHVALIWREAPSPRQMTVILCLEWRGIVSLVIQYIRGGRHNAALNERELKAVIASSFKSMTESGAVMPYNPVTGFGIKENCLWIPGRESARPHTINLMVP